MSVNFGAGSYGSISICEGNGNVVAGKFCSFAGNVKAAFYSQHQPQWITTFPFTVLPDWPHYGIIGDPSFRREIIIGNDVWIGAGVILLGGCKIDDGAVIGAHSVVAGHIPPYAIAVGNPCREINRRFNVEQIAKLLQIKWWDWPIDRIKEKIPLLCSDKIEEFING